MYEKQISSILKGLYEQTNKKHDAYYQEGQGALFVPYGYSLLPQNVVYAISEMELHMQRQFDEMLGR